MTNGAPSGHVTVQEWQPSGDGYINLGHGERLVSMLGGGLLALWGLRRDSLGILLSGGALIYRGIRGHCPVYERFGIDTASAEETAALNGIRLTLTVARPRQEVYAAWREFENLPRFMRHLESVTHVDGRRYHWVARALKDMPASEWDAEIVEDRKNELIAWQSLPGAGFRGAGWVSFRDMPSGAGTEVHVVLLYGATGTAMDVPADYSIAPAVQQLIREDIFRFKRYMEEGETQEETSPAS
jgi:uncharacterized membrane protein